MFTKNKALGKNPDPKLLKAQFDCGIDLEQLFGEVSERVSVIPRNERVNPFNQAFVVYDVYEFDLPSCGVCQGGNTDHLRALVVPGSDNVSEIYPIPNITSPRLEEYRHQYTLTRPK